MTLHRVEAVELVEIEGGDQFLGQTSPQISTSTPSPPWQGVTLQNWMPRSELPRVSRGGDQSATHITLGTTRRMAPDTPDLAGRPTLNANSPLRRDHKLNKYYH